MFTEEKIRNILTKHIDPLRWVDEITTELCYLIEHGDLPETRQLFEPKPVDKGYLEMAREILSLKRRDDGVFEFYEDGKLVEEWAYNDSEEAWGILIVKTLRHLRNILDKRLKSILPRQIK